MPIAIRNTLLPIRDLAVTAGPFVLLGLVLLALAYWVLDPTPPRHVTLATGGPQGAYTEFGRRYAALLQKHGIQVEIRTTQGAAENAELLRAPDSGVDIGFAQGGASDAQDDGLVSLGSVFYEPGWTDSLCKKVRLWLRPVAFELFRVITYFSAQTELAPKHQPWSEPADDRWRPPLSPSRVGTPLPAPRQRCPHLPIASLDATACRGG